MNAPDPMRFAQEFVEDYRQRMADEGFDEAEITDNLNIIQGFINIALAEIEKQGEIQLPEGQSIPLDEKTTRQCISLFTEGLYYGMQRCREMALASELKAELLQHLALELFNQSKQIVASTYGQEHTPDFQFSLEQQVNFINQIAESGLLYLINEYEKQNGPIHPEEPPSGEEAPLPPPEPEEAEADDEEAEASRQPAAPVKRQSPHDKYAAVALLLNTLKSRPERQQSVLKHFNAEERELIAFYRDPEKIAGNLDLAMVEGHLSRFRQLFMQGRDELKSQTMRKLETLVQSVGPEKLLLCVKDERPRIRAFLTTIADLPENDVTGEPWFSDILPPKIEQVLYRYLKQKLGSPERSSQNKEPATG